MTGLGRRRIGVIGGTLAGAGLVALAATGIGLGAPVTGAGQFAVPCKFDHRAMDDPIVSPGRPNTSHSHDFFGNRSTNAASTHDNLVAARATSCLRTADTSGYWAPTLHSGQKTVNPKRAQIYYLTAGRDPASIKPFPAGLRMIAGSAFATGPQDPQVVSYGCAGEAKPLLRTKPPFCAGRELVLHIRFPDCWNGLSLDSPDHKSHMTYATRVRGQGMVCPADHPVSVPLISLNIHYPVHGGPGVSLSSGPYYTAHADFFEAWQPGTQAALVSRCLNAAVICGAH